VVGLTVPVLTSERLRLVPVSDAHLPLFIELNSDPEVMRFIRGGPSTPQESRREWTRRRGPQTDEARGLGYWAGFEGERFVGWWSASSFADDLKTSGVGYRLRREAWGRGLATEGGRVMVNQAFGALSVEKVVASTISANAASRAVLRKLGMTGSRAGNRARWSTSSRAGTLHEANSPRSTGKSPPEALFASRGDPRTGHHIGCRSSSIAGEGYFGW
jgi:RimJ/RimL family protein N-acetyltransferase